MNPLDIPCCPFCDNAIEEWHEHKIVVQHGSKFLAHADCYDDDDPANKEEEEE